MKRYLISGLALALALPGGCTGTNQARLDPDVEMVLPAPSVAYVPPSNTVYASGSASTTVIAPATTTVVVPAPGTAIVQAPGSTVVAAPGTVTVAPSAGATTVVPAPAAAVATPATAIPQMLQADGITTQRVRAHTIYANRIDADEIQGVIHQDRNLKVADTRGQIKAPEVVASVIYADDIKANSIIAEHIYVRDLRRR